MKIALLILTGLLSSCGISHQEKREEYCAQLENKALMEIEKGNLRPVLKGAYIYTDVERYYIWKKYKVNIVYPIHLDEFYQMELDICYNSIMLRHTPVSKIIRDLDSLTATKNNSGYDHPKSKFIRRYHDGIFSVELDSNNNGFVPIRIDTGYITKLAEFKNKFEEHLSDTIRCEFWYEIDTLGKVNNIEIVHHATEIIDEAVIAFYASFSYMPANDGVKKLNYRNNDVVYFLGKRQK